MSIHQSIICPTVLAHDPHDFRQQMERIAPFARRVQVDLTDGLFAKPKSIELDKVWWPHSLQADLHLMYHRPDLFVDKVLELAPHMVIVHAEAEGDFTKLTSELHAKGIKVGVCLLKETEPDVIRQVLGEIDHVLIFSGDLGHFGGQVDFSLLEKVKKLKSWKSELEIGWDGGINDKNAERLMAGGVDVLNVGGYIQNSDDPSSAYATLETIIKDKNEEIDPRGIRT